MGTALWHYLTQSGHNYRLVHLLIADTGDSCSPDRQWFFGGRGDDSFPMCSSTGMSAVRDWMSVSLMCVNPFRPPCWRTDEVIRDTRLDTRLEAHRTHTHCLSIVPFQNKPVFLFWAMGLTASLNDLMLVKAVCVGVCSISILTGTKVTLRG